MRILSPTLAIATLACLSGAAAASDDFSGRPPVPTQRVAFVTSTTYNANLGGLAGADALCQARATAGSLANPTAFRAWLSTATTDAYCHVQGLTGKQADNCGQATLPAGAGPWVRVDGFPFAGRIDEMVAPTNRVLAPPDLDELGAVILWYEGYWSNTEYSGAVYPAETGCENWTTDSAVLSAASGTVSNSSASWTTGTSSCDFLLRLLCLESGPAPPLPPHHSGGALAFVTSQMGNGDLSSWPQAGGQTGLAAGDAICRSLATSARLPAPDSFVALLSDGVTDAIDRLTLDGPWVRIDGVRIAATKADLTDQLLEAPLNVTQQGAYLTNWVVRSGSFSTGLSTGNDCADWTSSLGAVTANGGRANSSGPNWINIGTAGCDFQSSRIYCFSNVAAVIFQDDLESAGTTAWSTTVQ